MRLLREHVSERELKVYELLCQRVIKAYDQVSSHFRLYLGFNTGALAVFGYLVSSYLGGGDMPFFLSRLLKIICGFGGLFSLLWFLMGWDDRRWILLINRVLGNAEAHIFEDEESAVYTQINETYDPTTKPMMNRILDATDLNLWMPVIFLIIWLVLLFYVLPHVPTDASQRKVWTATF